MAPTHPRNVRKVAVPAAERHPFATQPARLARRAQRTSNAGQSTRLRVFAIRVLVRVCSVPKTLSVGRKRATLRLKAAQVGTLAVLLGVASAKLIVSAYPVLTAHYVALQ